MVEQIKQREINIVGWWAVFYDDYCDAVFSLKSNAEFFVDSMAKTRTERARYQILEIARKEKSEEELFEERRCRLIKQAQEENKEYAEKCLKRNE